MFLNACTSRQSYDKKLFPNVRMSRLSYDGSEKNATIENHLSNSLCWATAPTDCCSMFLRRIGDLSAKDSLSANILVDSLGPKHKFTTIFKKYEPSHAFDYIKDEGLPTKSVSPFTCKKNKHEARKEDGHLYQIPNWVEVPIFDSEMVIAMSSSGSMVVDLVCGEAFDKLKGQEIYRGPSKAEKEDYPYRHSVVVCGYDTIQRGEEICWRVKNSKGTTWGDKGYGNVIFRSHMPPDSVPFIERAYAPCMF